MQLNASVLNGWGESIRHHGKGAKYEKKYNE